MVVGLASTAIPFADSPDAEAERWLRILRLHGGAGRALTALGVGEAPVAPDSESAANGPADSARSRTDSDVIHRVNEQAARVAAGRGTATVGTEDVLLAVMDVYGPDFDRVLGAYGTSHDDVIECLATGSTTTSDGWRET